MRSMLAAVALSVFAVAVASPAVAEAAPSFAAAPVIGSDVRRVLVRIDRATDGRGVQVDIEMLVQAPAETLERMVRDVERWPDWIPGMKRVAIVDGDRGAREFVTLVALPWPLRDVAEHLVLQRTAESGGGVRLGWTQVAGDLRRNEGSWTLHPYGPNATRVVYRANFQLGTWVPMFLVRRAGERQAPRFIENMQRRAAIMAGRASSATPPRAG